MKTVAAFTTFAALVAVAAAAPADQSEKLKFGDWCVTYVKDPATNYMTIALVDCNDAPTFTWDSENTRFEVELFDTEFCVPEHLQKCSAPTYTYTYTYSTAIPTYTSTAPPTCSAVECAEGEYFNQYECRCKPKNTNPTCKIQCPPGEELVQDGHSKCYCKPIAQCLMACPDGEVLTADCECVEATPY